MLTNKGKQGPWGKTLKLINQCPICSHDYKSEPANLFAHKANAQFIHITCDNCKISFMAMIMTLGKGVSTIGMITDLNFHDAKRLHECPPITIDDAIEAHELLKNPDLQNLLLV